MPIKRHIAPLPLSRRLTQSHVNKRVCKLDYSIYLSALFILNLADHTFAKSTERRLYSCVITVSRHVYLLKTSQQQPQFLGLIRALTASLPTVHHKQFIIHHLNILHHFSRPPSLSEEMPLNRRKRNVCDNSTLWLVSMPSRRTKDLGIQ